MSAYTDSEMLFFYSQGAAMDKEFTPQVSVLLLRRILRTLKHFSHLSVSLSVFIVLLGGMSTHISCETSNY